MTQDAHIRSAEIVIWAKDLKSELPFFQNQLGFRLDEIYPADDPAVAVISGHGLRLRLDRSAPENTSEFVLRCDAPSAFETEFVTSPTGDTGNRTCLRCPPYD